METPSLFLGALLLAISCYLWMNVSFQHSPFQCIPGSAAERFNEGMLIATSLVSGLCSGLILYLWITEKAPACGDPTKMLIVIYLLFYALLGIVKVSFFRTRILIN